MPNGPIQTFVTEAEAENDLRGQFPFWSNSRKEVEEISKRSRGES